MTPKLATINNLYDLKSSSLRIHHTTKVYWPLYHNTTEYTPDVKGKKRYCYNSSCIAFEDDNVIFTIPYTAHIEAILKNAGFEKEEFNLPFGRDSAPAAENLRTYWSELRKEARLINA